MAITYITHTSIFGLNTSTTPPIDTSACNLLTANLAGFASAVLSDSVGGNHNNWILAAQGGTNAVTSLYYCLNPHVGPGHTFTFTGANVAVSMQIQGFSGAIGFEGASSQGGGTSASGLSPGALVPSTTNELFVTGYEKENGVGETYTVSSLFNITDQASFDNVAGHFGGGIAYKLSSSTENPFWSGPITAGRNGATMATFTSAPPVVPVNPPTIQGTFATSAAGPTTVATMPMNVTAGNLLVVMTGHPGGNECGTAVFTDTRGLVFSLAVGAENVNGAQSNSCIYIAPITSSGPEVVTRTIAGSNYPVVMFVAEVTGISVPIVVSTSAGTADGGTAVASGNVSSGNPNLLLLGMASDANANPFTSTFPVGGTSLLASPQGAFLINQVTPGSYNTSFAKTAGGIRFSAAAALISFSIPVTQIGVPGAIGDSGSGQKGFAI